MSVLVFIPIILIGIVIWSLQGNYYKSKINEEIKALGGQVILIERRGLLSGYGPFSWIGKGQTVYRIEYQVNGKPKEGWVRFGGFFGPDWKL